MGKVSFSALSRTFSVVRVSFILLFFLSYPHRNFYALVIFGMSDYPTFTAGGINYRLLKKLLNLSVQ